MLEIYIPKWMRALRKFSDEQIKNLAIITRLMREIQSFYELIKE